MEQKTDNFNLFYTLCLSMGLRLNEDDLTALCKEVPAEFYIKKQKQLLARVRNFFIVQDARNRTPQFSAINNRVSLVHVYRVLSKEKRNEQ
ncbi:hypothetical protein VQ7734_00736 [Vibrio quintilis]|uniref:Uncharacterized protein n=1 Tax=Vibrio quintilis TaxID=1117707 RepID=A0A1M7YQZ6_9VIBR|nr:hypothetical protein VQ7734_00736 [Vibrio quintilis]